jgi:hypothetical protein
VVGHDSAKSQNIEVAIKIDQYRDICQVRVNHWSPDYQEHRSDIDIRIYDKV